MQRIVEELERITRAKTALRESIGRKGVDVSETALLDEYASAVNSIVVNMNPTEFILGTPVTFDLQADRWNGTNYTITITDQYTIGANGLQIGLPVNTSASNMEAVCRSAITMVNSSESTNRNTNVTTVTINLSSVRTPSVDVSIAIFGLIPKEASS